MKAPLLLKIACIALLFVGCGPKKTNDAKPVSNSAETTQEDPTENLVYDTKDLSGYDMALLDEGKLFFYNTTNGVTLPYLAESDSVVNCVFTQDGMLYYCVADDSHILLRCIDMNQPDPQPQSLADWGVSYQSCVTETYETVSPLIYYAGRGLLGLWHEFSWDSYSLTQQKLYNLSTGEITDWDWETWENEELAAMEDESDDHYEFVKDELSEYLTTREDNYYFQDGLTEACLTDKIDLNKYVSDPDYASDPEFEYVSASPDNLKVLFMAILEWGDFPHGILCISSIDGEMQLPIEDSDCTGFNAEWLDDGSLVYVGQEPLSPDAEGYDENWHYSKHCIKRIYPDGHTEIISHCSDFQLKSI